MHNSRLEFERTVDPTHGVVEIIVTRTTTLNTASASLVVNSLAIKCDFVFILLIVAIKAS